MKRNYKYLVQVDKVGGGALRGDYFDTFKEAYREYKETLTIAMRDKWKNRRIYILKDFFEYDEEIGDYDIVDSYGYKRFDKTFTNKGGVKNEK